MSLPVYTVAVQGRSQASVATVGRPVVASVTVPGPQGTRGVQGIQGPPGIPLGFGQITYTNRSLEPDDVFQPGVRAQILFTPDVPTIDVLNAPFTGHMFWVDNTVVPRAMGDLYDVQVNLLVTADTADGQLLLDADVGSALGPVATDTALLFKEAGVPERVTFKVRVQVLAGFLANGCRLFLTSSVRITTVSETVLIAPISRQDGT